MTLDNNTRISVHDHVTSTIIAAIEAGAGDWQMPWHRSGGGLNRPVNIDTGNRYQGVNIIALWAAGQLNGFASGTWGTYRQWQQNGAQVRKGEKGSVVVFYKELDITEADPDTGEAVNGRRLFARASRVFNADQVDGFEVPMPEPVDPVQAVAAADHFVQATGANIRHGGGRACYRPSEDIIQMPDKARFLGTETSSATESYYATLLHELTHWTGVANRCDRQFGKRFGDDAYAIEELVAELGAAFLCADLGVTLTPRPDHAAYLDNWLKVLKADNRAIFTAAARASEAVAYLAGLQVKGQAA